MLPFWSARRGSRCAAYAPSWPPEAGEWAAEVLACSFSEGRGCLNGSYPRLSQRKRFSAKGYDPANIIGGTENFTLESSSSTNKFFRRPIFFPFGRESLQFLFLLVSWCGFGFSAISERTRSVSLEDIFSMEMIQEGGVRLGEASSRKETRL